MNPWCTRHRPGRCPGLTNGRPVGAAVVRQLESFSISPERAANHQPRATPWAPDGTHVHGQPVEGRDPRKSTVSPVGERYVLNGPQPAV